MFFYYGIVELTHLFCMENDVVHNGDNCMVILLVLLHFVEIMHHGVRTSVQF